MRSLGSAVYSGGKIVKLTGTFQNIDKYKRAEEALRESEAKNRAILKVMPDSLFRITKDGIFLEVMPAKELATYINPDEFTGRSISEFSPDVAQQFMQEVKKALETKDTRMFEYQQSLQGEMRYHEARIVPSGKDEVLSIVRDITERKKTEEEVKNLKKQMEYILGATKTGLDIIDSDFNIRYIDPEWQKVYGDPTGKKCHQYFMGRDRVCPGCGIVQAMQTKKITVTEEILIKEGNRPIQVTTIPFQNEKGEWLAAEVNADITERKQAEEALRVALTKYETLFDLFPLGITVSDKAGQILETNPMAERLLGVPQEEHIRREIDGQEWRIVRPDGTPMPAEEYASVRALKENRLVENVEMGIVKARGEITWISVTATPLPLERYGVVITYGDVTEKKKMEAQLIQSERLAAVGTLAYGIAHEFNNILAGILGNAEFGMGNEDTQEVKECFQIIVENCERAKSITNHLLAFSKQRETKKQRADVTGAVESVLGLVERELEKRNIKVERKFNPIPDIVCDLGELSEVALNMITNARDAMQPRGGKLTIEINKKKDNIEMIFTDTGGGIPESIKSRIFEPFVTTKGALGQSETPGTGLGLFLSYGIISRYQGKIEVKSEVGKGSQFTIKIPISKNQTLPVSVEEDELVDVPPHLHILLVDDEKPILSSIKKFLESKGHSVVACPSGKKGLQLFKNRIFDVVLSDITLPDMDGIKLISKLKSIDRKVRLIVLTGHLAEEKLNSARKAGADHILTKPFKNEDLYKAIGRVVNG